MESNSKSTLKSLSQYATDFFPKAAYGVYPIEDDSKIAIILVANKYSPNNFWYAPTNPPIQLITNMATRNGRWRSYYVYDPSSNTLEGTMKVDVHYYEDGNVRLLTTKPVSASIPSGTGSGILKEVATAEKKYQDELNRGFTSLSENTFKGLRRQLPITRQKIEWEKVAGYRLGQDIGGGSSRR
jgi:hypothetical protein